MNTHTKLALSLLTLVFLVKADLTSAQTRQLRDEDLTESSSQEPDNSADTNNESASDQAPQEDLLDIPVQTPVEEPDAPVSDDQQEAPVDDVDKVAMIVSMLNDMKESFDGDITMYQAICNELENMVSDFERNAEIRNTFVGNMMNWLSGADVSLATMQNNFNNAILEKDAQIEQLTSDLATAQQNAQQEITSLNDVIAQLNGNLTNLQSSYDSLYASSRGDIAALAESLGELSDKYNTLVTERNQSLVLIQDLKGTITQYFDLDQVHMNEIQENLPTLP